MRLTNFTDYGLRILMRVASEPDHVHSTMELAEEFALSRNHLAKIVQRLAEGGVLTTLRGSGGGIKLARAPEHIYLGELVKLLERDQNLVECWSLGLGTCSIDGKCRLKARLRHAEASFLADLNKSTLGDIALKPRLGLEYA